MKVKIRHIDKSKAIPFTECRHDEIDSVIDVINNAGGVYCEGEIMPFNSYQIILNDTEAFVEIIVGKDE